MDNIPTVYPYEAFDPREDADMLHEAMRGLGTDEQTILEILCHRSPAQRIMICETFKSGYGKDLVSKLKSELGGNFEKVMLALCLPRAEFMAHEINKAMIGLGTKEGSLIEILCSGTNYEIREMVAAYERLYDRPMEEDIEDDTSGDFKRLLVALAQGGRDEEEFVNVEEAVGEAERLYSAGEGKFFTDESTFNSILATRSWAQLRQIMYEYQVMHGHTLQEAVAREFSFNAERGLLEILEFAENRHAYFAHRLHRAMNGLGTKDHNLIRIIVSRSDIDLGNIKHEYKKMYNQSLSSDVSEETSGHYRKALLALLIDD